MKKILFSLCIGGLMAGCASNDPKVDGPDSGKYVTPEVSGYLAIKVMAPGGLYGRANADYQYGTAEENYVNEVRFYFFDNDGNPVDIRKNPMYEAGNTANGPEYYSYYDWDPTEKDNNNGKNPDQVTEPSGSGSLEDGTVEKILTTMVALTAKNSEFPSKIVAIINPTADLKTFSQKNPTPSLSQLQAEVYDNLTGLTDKNFLMSSSVYVDENKSHTIAQPISEGNLGQTEEEALSHPMTVYVERAVAKLNLTFAPSYTAEDGQTAPEIKKVDGVNLYPTQVNITTQDKLYDGADAPEGQLDGTPIYVKFFGWAVTSTPTKSYLIKKINKDWAETLLGSGEPWSVYQYHRSFWATNPTLSTDPTKNDYEWYTFNELSGENYENEGKPEISKVGFSMDKESTYMQENASPAKNDAGITEYPTKVIFAAQLVDEVGNPITLAEWNGVYFTLQGLKILAAKMLDMYYYDSDTKKYVGISPDDITFKTSSAFSQTEPLFSTTTNYNVYAVLTDGAASKKWLHLSDNLDPETAGESDYTEIKDTNSYMQTVFGDAKIWNNGYTYYYLTITHLGEDGKTGQYGVVRNHIYASTVTGITGLGTPVWDPNEKIFPEKPAKENNKLSAQVKVLNWRIVTDDYEFEW